LTAAGNTAAIEFLNKVVSLDSSYAPAFSELGLRMSSLGQNLLMGRNYQKMAEKYYLKALDLNNNLLTALVEVSSEYTEVGKYDDAMKLIMKAYKINPNDATVNFRMSYLYRYVGMLKKSEKHGQRALELDLQIQDSAQSAILINILESIKNLWIAIILIQLRHGLMQTEAIFI
jgi:tetratricopeptide (TPR) repeat protein